MQSYEASLNSAIFIVSLDLKFAYGQPRYYGTIHNIRNTLHQTTHSRTRLDMLHPILLLILHRDIRQLRLQRIRRLTRKPARRDPMLKHEIQLRVREALWLGEAEVTPRDEQQGNAGPEEAALCAPVPVVLADHLGHDGVCDKDNGVVGGAGEGDGFDA
jgi:hypothetical protein